VDPRRLERGEVVAVLGGILLGVSLPLAWFTLGNRYTTLRSCRGAGGGGVACSGLHALAIPLVVILLIAALAPLVLAYIIVRGHALSWPRGELTAVVALVALTVVIFRGLIDKPGFPTGEISVSWGWGVAMLGAVLILIGAVWRSQESAAQRKPPGVL
jgi:hypothetical protein